MLLETERGQVYSGINQSNIVENIKYGYDSLVPMLMHLPAIKLIQFYRLIARLLIYNYKVKVWHTVGRKCNGKISVN